MSRADCCTRDGRGQAADASGVSIFSFMILGIINMPSIHRLKTLANVCRVNFLADNALNRTPEPSPSSRKHHGPPSCDIVRLRVKADE